MKFIVKNIKGIVNKKYKSINISDELQIWDKLHILKDSSVTITTKEDEYTILEDGFTLNECMDSEIFNIDFNFFNIEDGFIKQILKNTEINKVINEKYQQESLIDIIKQRDNNTLQDPIFQEALQKIKENIETNSKHKIGSFIRQKEETNVLSIKQIQKIAKEQQNLECNIDDIEAIKNHISNIQNFKQDQDNKNDIFEQPKHEDIDQKIPNENIQEKTKNINKNNKHLSSTELKELLGSLNMEALSSKSINEMLDLTSLKMSEEDIIEAAKKINIQNHNYDNTSHNQSESRDENNQNKQYETNQPFIKTIENTITEHIADKINLKDTYETSNIEPKYTEEIPLSKRFIPSQELNKILGEYNTSIFYNTINDMVDEGFIGMNEEDVISLAKQIHTNTDVSLHSLNEEEQTTIVDKNQEIYDKLNKVDRQKDYSDSKFSTIKQIKEEEEQLKENIAIKQAMARQNLEISKLNNQPQLNENQNTQNTKQNLNIISITNIINYKIISNGITLNIQNNMDFANRKDWFFD